MSDVLSFAEIDGQHVELLPARTVLSSYCGYHSYHSCYWGHYDYDYYNHSNTQVAVAEAEQSINNYGGIVFASNEANAINKA